MSQPNPETLFRVIDLCMGKWRAQAVYAAAELGVADALASGPRAVGEIARAVGAHEESLYRLLRALTVVGLFHEEGERRFSLTEAGALLRTDSPSSLRDWARYMGDPMTWAPWGELLHGVRTGESAFVQAFGTEPFAYLSEHPAKAAIFDGAMTAVSRLDSAAVAASYDFSGFRTVMDVAGGYGLLLATVLKATPGLRGILFEMPHVLDGARKFLAAEGVLERCTLVGGSFFEEIPAGADGIMMKHIVHDWGDEACERILRNCRTALPEGGKLLVLDALIPPPNEPHFGKLLDLEMLVVTANGRERTEEEFRSLFDRAGFRLARSIPTPAPIAVIEGELRA